MSTGGLSRDAAEYVLNTFPTVRREDEAAFGTYRTCDMKLAYYECAGSGGYGDEGGGVIMASANLSKDLLNERFSQS